MKPSYKIISVLAVAFLLFRIIDTVYDWCNPVLRESTFIKYQQHTDSLIIQHELLIHTEDCDTTGDTLFIFSKKLIRK